MDERYRLLLEAYEIIGHFAEEFRIANERQDASESASSDVALGLNKLNEWMEAARITLAQ